MFSGPGVELRVTVWGDPDDMPPGVSRMDLVEALGACGGLREVFHNFMRLGGDVRQGGVFFIERFVRRAFVPLPVTLIAFRDDPGAYGFEVCVYVTISPTSARKIAGVTIR